MTLDEFKILIDKTAEYNGNCQIRVHSYIIHRMNVEFEKHLNEMNDTDSEALIDYALKAFLKHKSIFIKSMIVSTLNRKNRHKFKNYFEKNQEAFFVFFNKLHLEESYQGYNYHRNIIYITPNSDFLADMFDKEIYLRGDSKSLHIKYTPLTTELAKKSKVYQRYSRTKLEKESLKNNIFKFFHLSWISTLLMLTCLVVPGFIAHTYQEKLLSKKRISLKFDVDASIDVIDFLINVESSKVKDLHLLCEMQINNPELFSEGKLIDQDYYNLINKV